jgi:Zn-dependent protease with chaperone function
MEKTSMESDTTTPPLSAKQLQPMPYHLRIVDYLKREEAELWNWFSSNKVRQEHGETVRLDLLKTTYRLEQAAKPQLYELAQEVLGKLNIAAPITFYQANNANGLNAALAYLPAEAHIILIGPILSALSEAEIKALLGHELAHFALFEGWDGELLVASEILLALNNDAAAQACHRETSRLFRLYGEIVADRGAYAATGDPLVTISKLVKVETGLTEVSAESYLRQAEEILSKGPVKANQQTHPETFIRAKAIKLFADKGTEANGEIQQLIQGSPALDELDLLGQQDIATVTRELLNHFLAPPWFQTEPVLAHARTFFPDFTPAASAALNEQTAETIKKADPSLQEYFGYLLLDFVAVDRQLEETPLAAALLLSEQLGFGTRFGPMAFQELAMTKKRFTSIERDAAKILQRANSTTKES